MRLAFTLERRLGKILDKMVIEDGKKLGAVENRSAFIRRLITEEAMRRGLANESQ